MTTSSSQRITAVVFDLGNVLVGWDPYLAMADRMTRDEWQRFALAADFSELNVMADRGVPLREVIRRAGEKGQEHGELIRQYFEGFERSLTGPVPGVAEIVRELRAAGLRLLGLTNWSAETFVHAPESAPAIRELEAVVVSGEEGLAKPDPALFRRLIETYDLVPDETVFVDDSEHNVRAAAELGLVALRFTDADRLREDLRRVGALA